MLPWDPNGKLGPKKPIPDNVNIAEPKEDYVASKEPLAASLSAVVKSPEDVVM